jgi:hypothetical protein
MNTFLESFIGTLEQSKENAVKHRAKTCSNEKIYIGTTLEHIGTFT